MTRRNFAQIEPVALTARERRGGYIPPALRAQTLEQLKTWCREHGDAAVQRASWSAAATWFMRSPEGLSNPAEIVSLSLGLCSDADAARLGLPSLSAQPYGAKAARFSAEALEEARLIGAETITDWERAGRPHLSGAVERTQQYINACFKQQQEDQQADGGKAAK